MPLDPHAHALVDLVSQRRDQLATRIVDRLRQELPSYTALPASELISQLNIGIGFVADMLRTEGTGSHTMLTAFTELRGARTRDGVGVQTLVRAVRIAAREAMEFAQTLAAAAEIDTAATFALTTALWDWVETIVEHLTPTDADDDERRARDIAERRFVTACVNGEASADEVAAAAAVCGIDASAGYHVVRARPANRQARDAVREALRPPARAPGVVTTLDDEVVAMLSALPTHPLPFQAGAGPAVLAASGRMSYLVAGRVLRAAMLSQRTGLLTVGDIGLDAAVTQDHILADALTNRYLVPLHALGAFGGQLLDSLRAYFDADLNVDNAAKKLVIHPNTLRHRLARFEDITGGSLHHAAHIAEVWWVLRYHELHPQANTRPPREGSH
jgi:hypothetical protein